MLTDFLAVWPLILSLDFARYALAAGLLSLALLALRQRLRARQIRDTAVPPAQVRSEVAASLRTVLVFSLAGFLVHAGMKAGVLGAYGRISEYGWTYFAASVLLAIVAHDTYFYWAHRLMHQPKLFRIFHRQHHRSVRPTPWAVYSFDAGEAVVQAAFLPLFLLIVPMHDLAILLFLTHMIARNMIGHCGVELFPRRAADQRAWSWTTTVTHHDLHHESFRYNYGLYFTWWDRLMGTEHPQYRRRLAGAGKAFAVGTALLALVGAHPAPALAQKLACNAEDGRTYLCR
ncbi:MAG: sterol desaturase family protein [Burkholderiales bacterium]|jgi:sterol desaturase/sphingolipid hydroxylase (fatty acid hydroxylase superfamily)|nr:sterol desaturase family protein [Burkholderiales bacterium]